MGDLPSEDEEFSLRKNTLALRLQQRRSRKVLAEQGIIPPLKSPGTYFEQVQRLERARKEDYLNRAIQIRPERDTLVQKHILEDTSASNQLVACQKDLKKAKLADDLNDKIAFRPGIIELVERNIFPADDKFQEALKGGHLQYKKIADFVDEDSSDAFSPDQQPPTNSSPPLPLLKSLPTSIIDNNTYAIKNETYSLSKSGSGSSLYLQSNSSHPYLSRQSSKGSKGQQSNVMMRMSTARKKKEKPKFKKFKYHQYVPPDQQGKSGGEHNLPNLGEDTPYSRLLEQQQLYLQIQIMNNQFSNNRQNEGGHGSFSQQSMVNPNSGAPLMGTIKIEKPRINSGSLTPAKLEEMKVSELKEELKSRGCKVTGTKEILIERLKPFCVKPFFNLSKEYDSSKINEMSYPSNDDLDSTSRSPLTYDPNTGFTHRIARMPHPEMHKVTLKQEKFTMPTWHQNVPGGSRGGGIIELDKDKMLEKQQKEIDDLKRMVELHRSQLQHLQTMDKGEAPKGEAPKLTSFQFPTFQPNIPQRSQPNHRNPPNYNHAYEMLNNANENRDAMCQDMDDLLDILKDSGELPNTPNIVRGKPHVGKPDYYPHQPHNHPGNHRPQPPPQQQQGYHNNDLTKMLVESSGDALMDTSNFPPVSYTTTLNDTYHTTTLNDSYHNNNYSSARNSFDSGVIYSTPHFSPMDTNSQEFVNDLRLSTSSLDSGEPTLNAVSLSPRNMTLRPLGSSPRTHNHLIKSASQELLGPNRPVTQSELGWLDLTLGSAVGAPPSPGFDPLSFEDPQLQMRYNNGSQDNGLNCYATGSTGALNYPPSTTMGNDPQWDTWEGLLSNNFNS